MPDSNKEWNQFDKYLDQKYNSRKAPPTMEEKTTRWYCTRTGPATVEVGSPDRKFKFDVESVSIGNQVAVLLNRGESAVTGLAAERSAREAAMNLLKTSEAQYRNLYEQGALHGEMQNHWNEIKAFIWKHS